MRYLYLDIETIPCQDEAIRADLVANAKPPANYKNPETIELLEVGEETKTKYLEQSQKTTKNFF